MKYSFLTQKTLLKSVLGDIAGRLLPSRHYSNSAARANESIVKKQQNGSENTIKIVKRKNGERIVTKEVRHRFKNLAYYQLLNEASMMKALHGVFEKINIPKFVNFNESKHRAILSSEHVDGKKISEFSELEIVKYLSIIVDDLRSKTIALQRKNIRNFPIRKNTYHIFSFSFIWLVAVVKEPLDFHLYLKYLLIFYKNVFTLGFTNTNYVLSHRDLDPENIIVRNRKPYLIDLEILSLAEPEVEIATISRYYGEYISKKAMINFINRYIISSYSKKRFVSLAIYYAFQMLLIEQKESKFYMQAKNYLRTFNFSWIYPDSRSEYSLGEKVYKLFLLIARKVSTLAMISKKHSLILCYHAVEKREDWRFSTSRKDFLEQIKYLRINYEIVSLAELIRNPGKGKVALSFDDGYANLLRTVVPYLKKNNIPATFFVMSDGDRANRVQLANHKKLLTNEQIRYVKNLGFEIGFHSSTHENLQNLPKEMIKEDLLTGKKKLESIIGGKVNYFAYPRGLYSGQIIDELKKLNFKAAFTVASGKVKTMDMYKIPRYSVEGNISLDEFKASVSPIGLALGHIFMQSLHLKDEVIKYASYIKYPILRNKWIDNIAQNVQK